ncbi:MAG: serine/threonine-protein phosphatase [Rhodocyclaceae bacterium]|nr:serine/threonine-protein phosphatase [Rhodocyclaceae bacterium]
MDLDTATLSQPGGRGYNEDSCAFWVSERAACWVVCDGAGGHGGGDVASRVAVETIARCFRERAEASIEGVAELLQDANEAVIEQQYQSSELRNMRSTVVILAVDRENGAAVWGHVGDSRLYCIRDGRILHQTRDHSVVQSLVDAGYADVDALRSHPQRSVLLSALGTEDDFEASFAAQPLRLRHNDVFLLCTDGWWEFVHEEKMLELFERAASPRQWLELMEAELLANARPGHDNYTAVAVWLDDDNTQTQILGGQ